MSCVDCTVGKHRDSGTASETLWPWWPLWPQWIGFGTTENGQGWLVLSTGWRIQLAAEQQMSGVLKILYSPDGHGQIATWVCYSWLLLRMGKHFRQVNIHKEVVGLPFNCIDFSNCCLWATTFSKAFFFHSWLQRSVAPGDHITRDRMFINSVDGVSRVTTSPMIIAALLSECNLLSGDQMDYQLCWEPSGYQVSSKMYDQY